MHIDVYSCTMRNYITDIHIYIYVSNSPVTRIRTVIWTKLGILARSDINIFMKLHSVCRQHQSANARNTFGQWPACDSLIC